MKTAIRSGFLLAVFGGTGAAAGAPLQVEHVVRLGEAFPGVGWTTIAANPDRISINNQGEWVATIANSFTRSAVVGSMGVVATTDDDGNPTTGEDTYQMGPPTLNNRGDIAYGMFVANRGPNGSSFALLDTLVVNGAEIRRSLDPSSEPGLVFGSGFSTSGKLLNDRGEILLPHQYRFTTGGGFGSDQLVRLVPDESGIRGYRDEILVRPGLEVEAGTIVRDSFGLTPFSGYGFNNEGQAIYSADVIPPGGSTSDDRPRVFVDGQVVIDWMMPSSDPRYKLGAAGSIDINNYGDWAAETGIYDAETGVGLGTAIVLNGDQIIATNLEPIPGIGSVFGGVRDLFLTDAGDVIWSANWVDESSQLHFGIFLNGDLFASQSAGFGEFSLPNGNIEVSDNGEWLLIATESDGIYRVRIPGPGGVGVSMLAGICALRRRR